MTTNVIDVSGLTKAFGGKTEVNNVSLQVRQSEIVGVLGPNRSGKTTTIRLLCGLLRPDRASGTCLGFDLKTQSEEIKLLTGYMTQRFSFYEDLTIQENLEIVARLYNLHPRHEVIEAALRRIGLVDRRRQLAGALSGGWKQRLALDACDLHAPTLLLLDEPTAGVDPQARREFWDAIHTLAEEGGDGIGIHALHGRSRRVPSNRLHPRWRDSRDRHHRRIGPRLRPAQLECTRTGAGATEARIDRGAWH